MCQNWSHCEAANYVYSDGEQEQGVEGRGRLGLVRAHEEDDEDHRRRIGRREGRGDEHPLKVRMKNDILHFVKFKQRNKTFANKISLERSYKQFCVNLMQSD